MNGLLLLKAAHVLSAAVIAIYWLMVAKPLAMAG